MPFRHRCRAAEAGEKGACIPCLASAQVARTSPVLHQSYRTGAHQVKMAVFTPDYVETFAQGKVFEYDGGPQDQISEAGAMNDKWGIGDVMRLPSVCAYAKMNATEDSEDASCFKVPLEPALSGTRATLHTTQPPGPMRYRPLCRRSCVWV